MRIRTSQNKLLTLMIEQKTPRKIRFTAMTAYQFCFFTFYQLFERVSLDRAYAWKAGLVVITVEAWITFAILIQLNLLDLAARHPMLSLAGGAVIVALAKYYAFDHHDRWKRYAEQFKLYSKRELFAGRVVVAIIVVSSFVVFLVAVAGYRSAHGVR